MAQSRIILNTVRWLSQCKSLLKMPSSDPIRSSAWVGELVGGPARTSTTRLSFAGSLPSSETGVATRREASQGHERRTVSNQGQAASSVQRIASAGGGPRPSPRREAGCLRVVQLGAQPLMSHSLGPLRLRTGRRCDCLAHAL